MLSETGGGRHAHSHPGRHPGRGGSAQVLAGGNGRLPPRREKKRFPLLPAVVSRAQNAVQAPPGSPREFICDPGVRKCDESYPQARNAWDTAPNVDRQHGVWSVGTGWSWGGKVVCGGHFGAGAVRTHFKSSEVRWGVHFGWLCEAIRVTHLPGRQSMAIPCSQPSGGS